MNDNETIYYGKIIMALNDIHSKYYPKNLPCPDCGRRSIVTTLDPGTGDPRADHYHTCINHEYTVHWSCVPYYKFDNYGSVGRGYIRRGYIRRILRRA